MSAKMAEPETKAQLNYLRGLGVAWQELRGLTKADAGGMIAARRRAGQVRRKPKPVEQTLTLVETENPFKAMVLPEWDEAA
jgi:hypothetical protein